MTENNIPISIPLKGQDPGSILQEIRTMKEEDIDWMHGRAWSLVYYVNEEHDQLLKAASNELFSANYLNPLAFKSLHRMEQEVVHMSAKLLHGDEHTVGIMTTGGTESILLAMFCYRQLARKLHPKISKPEVIAPATIHPAFDKAAVLFGLKLVKAPVDENRCAIPSAMEKLVNDNTILMVASAPSYPNGVMDPIEPLAAIASKNRLPFHVDACIGGFMLPWIEKLGYDILPWDLRIPGVTSVSADVHKFGYGAKGASVLLYRSMDYLQHQFIITTDFPGGIYISPTLLGTRPGGPIAAAWAAMKHLGENGYQDIAKKLMDASIKLRTSLESIKGIQVVGKPCMNIISFTTINNDPDIYVIADQLEDRGWMIDRQQLPDCIHLTVLPTNAEVVDQFLSDLQSGINYAKEHPEATAKGNAAIYGLMARIPFRGMVGKSVNKIMQGMYGSTEAKERNTNNNNDNLVSRGTIWMGLVNRILFALARRKKIRKSKRRKAKANAIGSFLLIILALLFVISMQAQPYVDPLQVRYMHAFKNNKPIATPFTHLWIGSDVPVKLKEDSYLLLSPYYEQWNIDSSDKKEIFPIIHSLAIPVGIILPVNNSRWSIAVIPTVRWNGEKLFDKNNFQFGGATFATFSRTPKQKFRFGVYMNDEFFGLFVVPLLGTDWRIDEKNYLFGILPGRLTYEHKLNDKLYWGATFRAITNSFRLAGGNYIRIDDNQTSAYMDYYLAKHLCLTLEPGYGIFRKLRTGLHKRDYITDVNMGDGFFIKLSAAYRVRL